MGRKQPLNLKPRLCIASVIATILTVISMRPPAEARTPGEIAAMYRARVVKIAVNARPAGSGFVVGRLGDGALIVTAVSVIARQVWSHQRLARDWQSLFGT